MWLKGKKKAASFYSAEACRDLILSKLIAWASLELPLTSALLSALNFGLVSLRSKRFRLVSEQRKNDFRFWPREKWNESQKMKEWGGGGLHKRRKEGGKNGREEEEYFGSIVKDDFQCCAVYSIWRVGYTVRNFVALVFKGLGLHT